MNLEVPSPLTGVIEEINAKNGEIVEVGALLGSISSNVSSKKVKVEKNEVSKSVSENNIVNFNNERKKDVPKIFDEEKNDLKEKPLVLINEIHEKKPLILKDRNESLSPAVRKIVSENNIDIKKISGSGKDGRILKSDLINIMGEIPKVSERKIKYGQEERIKMSRLRQTIAKRLKQAQENAALLTTFNEVDMTNI